MRCSLVRSNQWLAAGAAAVLALGLAACGSSGESPSGGGSSNSASSASSKQGGTINGAGATFPAPVYTEWAARLQDSTGTTVNYQAAGSAGPLPRATAGRG